MNNDQWWGNHSYVSPTYTGTSTNPSTINIQANWAYEFDPRPGHFRSLAPEGVRECPFSWLDRRVREVQDAAYA